jgi:RNA polymerase sigma factor (sigma-70 family)
VHLIQHAILVVCRKHRLSRDESEELASLAYLKVLDRDCAILHKFRGESQLTTFLVVVVTRILLDSRIARWGKWRPSVHARRLGRVAVMLEHCIFGRGMRFQEAAEAVRIRFGAEHGDEALRTMLSSLPERTRRRFVDVDRLAHIASHDSRLDPMFNEAILRRTRRVLTRVVSALPADDRMLLGLRFKEGLRICEIARRQGLDLKAIYRRFDRLMQRLRADLEGHGIGAADVHAWLSSR